MNKDAGLVTKVAQKKRLVRASDKMSGEEVYDRISASISKGSRERWVLTTDDDDPCATCWEDILCVGGSRRQRFLLLFFCRFNIHDHKIPDSLRGRGRVTATRNSGVTVKKARFLIGC